MVWAIVRTTLFKCNKTYAIAGARDPPVVGDVGRQQRHQVVLPGHGLQVVPPQDIGVLHQ